MNNKGNAFPAERNVQLKKRVMGALWGICEVLQKHTHPQRIHTYVPQTLSSLEIS